MKKAASLLLALFAAFSFSANAQSDSTSIVPKGTFHELGINGTFFLANFLTFSGNIPATVEPYALQYKVLFGGRNGIRFGIGANYRSQHDDPEFGTEVEFNTLATNTRLGYEHRLRFGKRWATFFGFDLVHNYSRTKNKTIDAGFQTVTITNTSHGGGGGPVVGIQFYVSPRISFGTETSVHFLTTADRESTNIISDFAPPSSSNDKTDRTSFNFNLPTSIYINITLGGSK